MSSSTSPCPDRFSQTNVLSVSPCVTKCWLSTPVEDVENAEDADDVAVRAWSGVLGQTSLLPHPVITYSSETCKALKK